LSVVPVPGTAGAVVRFTRDYRGQYLRLTDERLEHIVRQHPEAARLGVLAIEDALRHPDAVIVSPGPRTTAFTTDVTPALTWVTSSSALS